jgi:hypothetical protein
MWDMDMGMARILGRFKVKNNSQGQVAMSLEII